MKRIMIILIIIVVTNLFAGFTIEKIFEGNNAGIEFDVINDSLFVIGDQIIDSKGKILEHERRYGSYFTVESNKVIGGYDDLLRISDLDGKNKVKYELPLIYDEYKRKENNDFVDGVQINDTLFLITDYWKSGICGQKNWYPIMINETVLTSEQISHARRNNTYYVKDLKNKIYKVNIEKDNDNIEFSLSDDEKKYPKYIIHILNSEFYDTREFIIDKYFVVALRYGICEYPEKQKHELYAFNLKTGKYLNKTLLPSIFDYSNTNYVAFNNSLYYYLSYQDKYNVYKINYDECKASKEVLL